MTDKGDLLYDPTAEPRILAAGLAPRLASLEGTRAGILDNSKANAGTLMLAVVERLQGALRRPRRRQAREGHRGAALAGHPGRPDDVRLRPGRQRRLRVVHVVEYPRRHRAGAARHPDRRHGHEWSSSTLATLEARNRGLADLPLALIPHPAGRHP